MKKKTVKLKRFGKADQVRRLEGSIKGAEVSRKRSQESKRIFLEAFVEVGTVAGAAKVAGIDIYTHYKWLDKDADYSARYDAAKEELADRIEQEVIYRATRGVKRLKFHNGKQVYYRDENGNKIPYEEREFSDSLAMFWLKGRRPHVFKEQKDINVQVKEIDEAIAAELARVADKR